MHSVTDGSFMFCWFSIFSSSDTVTLQFTSTKAHLVTAAKSNDDALGEFYFVSDHFHWSHFTMLRFAAAQRTADLNINKNTCGWWRKLQGEGGAATYMSAALAEVCSLRVHF